MKTVWRRYLFVGLLAVGVDILLPVGLGRDLVCSLIAASGTAAIYESVRRNRPDHPSAHRRLGFVRPPAHGEGQRLRRPAGQQRQNGAWH